MNLLKYYNLLLCKILIINIINDIIKIHHLVYKIVGTRSYSK